jgi:hypothetical protein
MTKKFYKIGFRVCQILKGSSVVIKFLVFAARKNVPTFE